MRDCAEGLGLGLGVLRFRTIVTHAYCPTYEKIQLCYSTKKKYFSTPF